MTKSFSAELLHETLTTAQSLIGERKESLEKRWKYFTDLTMKKREGFDCLVESCVIMTCFNTTFQCYFPQGSATCASVISYTNDQTRLTDYRDYFNDRYAYVPEQRDCWYNQKENLFISILYDEEIKTYVICFMIAELKVADLSLILNAYSHVVN